MAHRAGTNHTTCDLASAQIGERESQRLAEILGVSTTQARSLLQQTGSVDAAVAMHATAPGPSSRQAPTNNRAQQLQRSLAEMGLGHLTTLQASQLLARSDQSVDQAVSLYLEDPSSRGEGVPWARARQQDGEVINLLSEDSTSENASAMEGNDTDDNANDSHGRNVQQAPHHAAPAPDHQQQVGLDAHGVSPLGPQLESNVGMFSSDDDDTSLGAGGYTDSELDFEFNARKQKEEAMKKAYLNLPAPPQRPNDGTMNDMRSTPSLTTAILAAACKQLGGADASRVPLEQLPLAHHRLENGRLYVEDPSVLTSKAVAPPNPPRFPLHLGSVLLPIGGLRREALAGALAKGVTNGDDVTWTLPGLGQSKPFAHDYFVPSEAWREHARTDTPSDLPILQLKSFPSRTNLRFVAAHPFAVQLALGSRSLDLQLEPKDDCLPFVTVGGEIGTWPAKCVAVIGCLELRGLLTVRYTLQYTPGEVAARTAPSAIAAASARHRGRGSIAATGRASGKTPQPTSRSRDKRKGKAPVEADAGDDRLQQQQQQQQQPPCSSSIATAPIAVRAEISLTPAGYDALFFDDATTGGDLAEVVESKATRKSSSDANNWRQFGESLSVLIACILQHGEGLRIGPDSDGIFNFMDTPHEEMHTEFQAPSANLPSKFDVNALLTSVAPHSNPTAHHPHDRVAPSATTTGGAGPSNAAALDSPLGNNNKHPLVLATATPPSGLVSSPKKYQLQGLQWMLDREVRGDAVGRGHALLHPAWTQLVTPEGYLLYVHRLRPHVLSSFFHLAPPVGTCGGCIADEMGLGKSLEVLMLVASNKPPRGWALSSLVNVSVNRENPAPIKTTLLVAPATLLNQWEAEVQRHLVPGTLTWGRVLSASEAATWLSTAHVQTSHGSSRDAHHQRAGKGAAAAAAPAPLATRRSVRPKRATKHYSGEEEAAMQSNDAAPLTITSANPHEFPVVPVYCRTSDQNHVVHIHQLDLALCSYELLRDQLSSETSTRPAPLHQFGYWRVCLDEAQLIANTNSVAAIMASSLWRRHAWVVTGTPITSRLDEVRGLLEFLALEPFHYSHVWNPLVKRECDRYSAQGLLAMRALLRGVLLRRSKADVEAELDLPPCVQEDVSVVLSSVERAVYERARREFLTAVSHAQSARAARQRRPRAGGTQQEPASGRGAATSGRVLTTLTALRQSTCHPQVVRSHDAMMGTNERLSMNAIMRRLLAQQLQEWESAARRVLDARAIALAVEAVQRGEDLEAALSPLLEEVRFHARVALVEDFVSVLEIANGGRHGGRYGTEGEGEGVNELQMCQGTMDIQKLEVLEAAQEERHAKENAELAGRVQEWEERFEAEVAALEAAKQDPEAKAALMPDVKGRNMAGGDRKTAKQKRKRHPKHAEDEEDKSDSDTMDDLDENENDDMDDNDEEDDSQGGVRVCYESTVKSKKARKAPRQKKRRGAAAGPKCDIVAMVQRALGRRPQLLEAVAEARRDARMRWRSWRRLELSSLELLAHVLKEEAASTARRLKKKARSKNASNPALGKRSASTAGNGPLGGSGSGGGHAGHAGPSDATNERDPDVNPAELALTRTQEAITQLRLELGLLIPESAGGGSGSVDIAAIRRSRRQAGIDADDDAEVDLDPVEVAAQLENAVIPVRAVKEMLAKRDPQHSARAAVAQARNEAAEAWHRVRYALKTLQESGCGNLHADTVNADAGTSNGVQQDQRDLSSCPICFDELMTERTITRCNHHFCNYCIREVLEKNGGAGICPICRQPLTESDLFDALSESEAQAMERAKEASVGDYGAKISALLVALARLRAANPDAKAVVFSSWGRLLHLVHEALTANGVDCAVMHGGGPERRQAELDRFLNDPDCGVLTVLMSTSGGAAGLTLTAATAGFILEPAINPGLERQAAARIYRLGQTRSTKIFRLLAEDTVDGAVVDQQRWKMERGEAGLAAEDVDHGTLEALAEKLKV